jgi:hypothetical protein
VGTGEVPAIRVEVDPVRGGRGFRWLGGH